MQYIPKDYLDIIARDAIERNQKTNPKKETK